MLAVGRRPLGLALGSVLLRESGATGVTEKEIGPAHARAGPTWPFAVPNWYGAPILPASAISSSALGGLRLDSPREPPASDSAAGDTATVLWWAVLGKLRTNMPSARLTSVTRLHYGRRKKGVSDE